MLVYYVDEKTHETRYELSKAVGMTLDMHFAIPKAGPRVLFPSIRNPEPPIVDEEEKPVEIDVHRKKA